MSKYFTKCGREFSKSTRAEVTGYLVSEDNTGAIIDTECTNCPFIVDVQDGWGSSAKHKRFECRAGSLLPNKENTYQGSSKDKCTLGVYSLHHGFCEAVIEFAREHPDLSAGYSQDTADCRRHISVSCSQNKKGMSAKQELIDKFFSTPYISPSPIIEAVVIIEPAEASAEIIEADMPTVVNPDMTGFDYAAIDIPTAERLKNCAVRISEIKVRTVHDIGLELSHARASLANHKNGMFGAWCQSIGFSRASAENYVRAYEFIAENFGNIEKAAAIQPSLLFVASKPSAPPVLAQAVVEGSITKHKDYVEALAKIKNAPGNVLQLKRPSDLQQQKEAPETNVDQPFNRYPNIREAILLLADLDPSDIDSLVKASGLECYAYMKDSLRMQAMKAAEKLGQLAEAIRLAPSPASEFVKQVSGR